MKRWLAGVALLLIGTSSVALAHKVRLFAWQEGDMIRGETAFSGGRVAQGAAVDVQNAADGSLLLTVTTDAAGNFAFAIPAAAREQHMDLRLLLRAGTGHQGEWLLAAADYLPGVAGVAAAPAQEPTPSTSLSPDKRMESVDATVIAQQVEQAVARQLAPLQRQLAELKDRGTEPRDIVGGIGYLVGLGGLLAYARSRKVR